MNKVFHPYGPKRTIPGQLQTARGQWKVWWGEPHFLVEKLTDRRVNSRPELGNPNSLHAIDDEGLCAPVDLRFARQERSLVETHEVVELRNINCIDCGLNVPYIGVWVLDVDQPGVDVAE
jgi:hypothetical protein